MDVTTAVRLVAVVGVVENVTVNVVAVADVTVPTAPSLNTTVLLAAVESKPNPLIVSVLESAPKSADALVTTGETTATCTAAPLPNEFEITVAVRFPAAVGGVVIEIVKDDAVAAVTVPTAPLLNVTVLLLAVLSNPKPLTTSVLASEARL